MGKKNQNTRTTQKRRILWILETDNDVRASAAAQQGCQCVMPPWLKCYLQKLFLYGKIEKWLIQVNVTASAAESSELRLTETQSSIKCYGDKSLLSWQQWQQFKQQQSTQAPRKPQRCILQNVMGGVDGKGGDEEATLDGGAMVEGWGVGGCWERRSYQPAISVQALYINLPEQ